MDINEPYTIETIDITPEQKQIVMKWKRKEETLEDAIGRIIHEEIQKKREVKK